MTPQEIKEITYNTVNYNQIIEKTTFMSENLGKRVNELKKELAVQYLTS